MCPPSLSRLSVPSEPMSSKYAAHSLSLVSGSCLHSHNIHVLWFYTDVIYCDHSVYKSSPLYHYLNSITTPGESSSLTYSHNIESRCESTVLEEGNIYFKRLKVNLELALCTVVKSRKPKFSMVEFEAKQQQERLQHYILYSFDTNWGDTRIQWCSNNWCRGWQGEGSFPYSPGIKPFLMLVIS